MIWASSHAPRPTNGNHPRDECNIRFSFDHITMKPRFALHSTMK
jgi:hypothetical protein